MTEPSLQKAPAADLSAVTTPITESLQPLGFKRKGKRDWFRATPEIEQVFRLQTSYYGAYHRLYLYGTVRRLKAEPSLSDMKYHMEGDPHRISRNEKEFDRALNREVAFDPEETRAEIIRSGLTGPVAALLQELETEAGSLRAFRRINNIGVFHVRPDALLRMHA